MTTAKARIAAWTLVLGLTATTATWAVPVHADSREAAAAQNDVVVALADGVMSWFGPSPRAAAPSSNVRVDPQTGVEIYVPTGERIDEVIVVIGARLPAATASIERDRPVELGLGAWTWGVGMGAIAQLGSAAFELLLGA